jgi:hypothetical protein
MLDTPASLAAALQTTPQTVNTWHRAGILPAKLKIGRVVRFDREEALAALAAYSSKKGVSQ